MTETKNYTVIFLVDQSPAKNILLLRRSKVKSFAPNYYTGIGGKVGDMPQFQNETILEGAYRELQEETLGTVSQYDTNLIEFARFRYQDGISIFYFAGTYSQYPCLPEISPTDGSLEWVNSKYFLQYDIIPTTKIICEIWAKNNFDWYSPFTVLGLETGRMNSIRIVKTLEVSPGLH